MYMYMYTCLYMCVHMPVNICTHTVKKYAFLVEYMDQNHVHCYTQVHSETHAVAYLHEHTLTHVELLFGTTSFILPRNIIRTTHFTENVHAMVMIPFMLPGHILGHYINPFICLGTLYWDTICSDP